LQHGIAWPGGGWSETVLHQLRAMDIRPDDVYYDKKKKKPKRDSKTVPSHIDQNLSERTGFNVGRCR